MKRTYESGSQKKKKDQRQEFISKLPKLSSFFTGTAAAAMQLRLLSFQVAASSEANDVHVCQQTDRDDAHLAVSIFPSSSYTMDIVDYDDNNDSNCETHSCGCPSTLAQAAHRECCSIVKMGPVQVKDKDFTQNEMGHRFPKAYYYIVIKNGKRVTRSWLVYSESADRVFCFCCRLFGKQKQQHWKKWNCRVVYLKCIFILD